MDEMITLIMMIGCGVLNTIAQLYLKKVALELGTKEFPSFLDLILNGNLNIGIGAYVLSLGIYIFVLTKIKLNMAYPIMTAINFIGVELVSKIYLAENFTHGTNIGILMVIGGIIVSYFIK